MPVVDVHQHLWPEPLLAALARRTRAPRLRRSAGDGWTIDLDGEPSAPVAVADHDPDRRAALAAHDGVDRVLIAPSSPLGIEALAPDEAWPLIDAYHAGVLALPDPFAAWGTVALADATPSDVERILDRGAVGLCLPAGALADPQGLDRCGPLLAALERRSAPLFVHPGPAPWSAAAPAPAGAPAWWAAMNGYVAGQVAAWFAWAGHGRPAHPTLRVCFALLAGGAPLHGERLRARGADAAACVDPLAFVETSSYGPRMVDATVRWLGVDQLVHGSDRPVATPDPDALSGALATLARERNCERLLGRAAVPA